MFGQRHLQEVRVDFGIGVVLRDDGEHFFLGDRRGELSVNRTHTDFGGVLALQPHVRMTGRIVTNEDRAEPRCDAVLGEALDADAEIFLHRFQKRVAVEQGRSHQWRKCRSPVNTMASPSSSAFSMIFSSRIPPPGWITAATPAAAAASMPSSNG